MQVSAESMKIAIPIVFGSGLAGALLKFWNDVNILKVHVDEMQKANLNVRVTTVEQSLSEIKTGMAKLMILDSMAARQEMLLSEVRDLRSSIVPRAEHEARWNAWEDKMVTVNDKLRSVEDKVSEKEN